MAGSMRVEQSKTGSLSLCGRVDKDELYHTFTQRPFSVQMLLRQRMEAGESAEYRTTYSAFIFTLSGRARLSFDDSVFEAEPHTVIHGCPGHLLRFVADGTEGFEHANIYYTACQVEALDDGLGAWMDVPFAFRLEDCSSMLERVVALEGLNARPSLDNRLRQIAGSTVLIRNLFASTRQSNAAKVDYVRSFLDAHYDEPLSLSELGDLVDMSPKHFSRCFSCSYGVSPMKYLVTRRLEQARLLLASGLKVSEAAAMVGYEDQFYFSRLFKKHYGCSPRSLKLHPQA
jgi:AraC-like DNA-binding protein